ncbi:hypothetical protein ACQEV4_40215 [Streptomyces shenzhenensis]|uniref:hypothetical protein n=1 Tax=Streptomyces shenzhenensis TaxID=943815 RepID=UPI003D90B4EE
MTDLDSELLEWVREFIYGRERVTVEDVRREFFPDEPRHPRLYLNKLKADGVIAYYPSSREYHWTYKPENRPEKKPEKKARHNHRRCTHANTAAERDKCRRSQGNYSASQLERVEAYRMDQEVRAEQELVGNVPRNVLDYVTREFNEGRAGNRDRLPSTYDVATACVRVDNEKAACRLAFRYLRALESAGEIIRVRDAEEALNAWVIPYRSTFWALNMPGIRYEGPVAVTVSGPAEEQWQIDLGHDIDAAETVPCVWGEESA